MNKEKWCMGESVSLEELLDYRELRLETQKKIVLNKNKTLIALTLNIVGPVKRFLLGNYAFIEGVNCIKRIIEYYHVTLFYSEKNFSKCGYEAYFLIDTDPVEVKKMLVEIEENHPLGRLFDIDVLDHQLNKISRKEVGLSERRCLLCNEPVTNCGPRRKHSAEDLFSAECELMSDFLKNKWGSEIAGLFSKAMTYEVTTTPKPGLVDRHHNGTHEDMDISLFMTSIDALNPYFKTAFLIGLEIENISELFLKLRQAGQMAEKAMYKVTNNVNTHKGLIFSGSILCGVIGYHYGQYIEITRETIRKTCEEALSSLEEDFLNINKADPKSHGEELYLRYGLKGIRGEAFRGFPTVFEIGSPLFNECLNKGFSLFEAGQITLLHLIAYSEDTNIITRSNYETFLKLQSFLQKFLSQNETGTYDVKTLIRTLDIYFDDKNISPGGSADLLALVYFIFFFERYLKKKS